jgi:hypothetical protein
MTLQVWKDVYRSSSDPRLLNPFAQLNNNNNKKLRLNLLAS